MFKHNFLWFCSCIYWQIGYGNVFVQHISLLLWGYTLLWKFSIKQQLFIGLQQQYSPHWQVASLLAVLQKHSVLIITIWSFINKGNQLPRVAMTWYSFSHEHEQSRSWHLNHKGNDWIWILFIMVNIIYCSRWSLKISPKQYTLYTLNCIAQRCTCTSYNYISFMSWHALLLSSPRCIDTACSQHY